MDSGSSLFVTENRFKLPPQAFQRIYHTDFTRVIAMLQPPPPPPPTSSPRGVKSNSRFCLCVLSPLHFTSDSALECLRSIASSPSLPECFFLFGIQHCPRLHLLAHPPPQHPPQQQERHKLHHQLLQPPSRLLVGGTSMPRAKWLDAWRRTSPTFSKASTSQPTTAPK
jgi:hypothetical protein